MLSNIYSDKPITVQGQPRGGAQPSTTAKPTILLIVSYFAVVIITYFEVHQYHFRHMNKRKISVCDVSRTMSRHSFFQMTRSRPIVRQPHVRRTHRTNHLILLCVIRFILITACKSTSPWPLRCCLIVTLRQAQHLTTLLGEKRLLYRSNKRHGHLRKKTNTTTNKNGLAAGTNRVSIF